MLAVHRAMAFFLAFAVATVTVGGALAPYEPAPELVGEGDLDGETWAVEAASHSLRLTPMTDAMRLEYFRKTTGSATDPFASREGVSAYVTFLLRIENRGRHALIYNPMRSWMVGSGQRIAAPVSGTDLRFDYSSTGRPFPVAYRKAVQLLFDEVRTVAPGEAVHGLLMFPSFEKPPRQFRIDVSVEIAGEGESTLVAAYRRVKPGKPGRSPGPDGESP